MRRNLLMPLVAVLAAVLAFGCSESPLESTADIAPPSSDFVSSIGKLDDAPAQSGLNVVRYEDNIWFWYWDVKVGLQALVGVHIDGLCAGGFPVDGVHVMDIDVPEHAQRIAQLIQAEDVHFAIYPMGMGPCGNLVAIGMADLVYTDNDLFTWQYPDNTNRSAFGFAFHGKGINPATGEEVNVSGHYRAEWDGWNQGSGHAASKINVH